MVNLEKQIAHSLQTLMVADVVAEVVTANHLDFLRQLVAAINKEYGGEKSERARPLHMACTQLVDNLVEKVLQFDQQMASGKLFKFVLNVFLWF